VTLCLNRLFPQVRGGFAKPFEQFTFHTLQKRRHFSELCLIQVYSISKFRPYVLGIVGISDLALYARNFV
jgi:hypothetical protein